MLRRVSCAALLAGACFFPLLAFGQTTAILPFNNKTPRAAAKSPDPQDAAAPAATSNLDWIGESIAETLRDSMTARGLLTIEREETDTAFRRLNLHPRAPLTAASAIKIGEALDAEDVVYGTFDWKPNPGDGKANPAEGKATTGGGAATGSLTIAARVYDRKRLHQGTEFIETGSLDDLATMEAHLIWRTLSLIAPKLAPPEADYRMLRPKVRLDAEENYVRGLLAAPDRKEKFFLQAARLDPNYAHPNFALGQLHLARKEYREAALWLQKVMPGDQHHREASFLLGLALFQSGDYAGAQTAFQTVADVVPLAEVWNDLGAAQNRRGQPQALDSFLKALTGDPSDPVYHFNAGYALWRRGDFATAADRFRAVLDRQPEDQDATLLLGMCLKKQGLRPGDSRMETLERLKVNYEERAYWELKAVLARQQP